jgi:hypothetical protein
LLGGRASCGEQWRYATPKGYTHHRGGLEAPKGAKLGETFVKRLYLGFGARSASMVGIYIPETAVCRH